jgi:hypothetical protein
MEILIPALIFAVFLIGSIIYEKRNHRISPSSRNNNQRITSNYSNQIRWTNIRNSSPSSTPAVGFNKVPDDIKNLLKMVIGNRDTLTQDKFLPGQKVYFCRRCRLAYHEDSWKELDRKCSNCKKSDKTGFYTLPNSQK